mmetsp:Transcript_25605/g.35360  ORF Transcript_25605/g.35360 Transcript_25605/m.35360 type:complete len:225 (-) Transcript_25605:72-746(-)|eukprot:CAMPEP_0196579916 /NCGR_PEP_ID=MMETSP1081-20130531/25710_1 /TAXON_ID=36882 /ORGANISM="Pyramimonas amylifera, Strain CCMP720" /LENGTH=224 /DNA_ID=CAMNT_0041899639 /DNA_START=110 /DNA_END=784 /DNA_ORIENTATION=-
MNVNYARVEYWDERYLESMKAGPSEDRGPLFDWLCKLEDVNHLIEDLPAASRVLDLGCGNSRAAESLAGRAGPMLQVEGVDFSPVCQVAMQQRAKQGHLLRSAALQYQVMDVLHLGFRDACFDLVIDKGCIDALLNAHDQRAWWERCGARGLCSYDAVFSETQARRMLAEVARVLVPERGVLMLVSLEPPQGRLRFLEDPSYRWSVKVIYDDILGNYIYLATRP